MLNDRTLPRDKRHEPCSGWRSDFHPRASRGLECALSELTSHALPMGRDAARPAAEKGRKARSPQVTLRFAVRPCCGRQK